MSGAVALFLLLLFQANTTCTGRRAPSAVLRGGKKVWLRGGKKSLVC